MKNLHWALSFSAFLAVSSVAAAKPEKPAAVPAPPLEAPGAAGGILTSKLPVPLMISPELALGYSSSSVAFGGRPPSLMQLGAGLTAAFVFEKIIPGPLGGLMVGLRTEFRWINQYSNPDLSRGNHYGYRWSIISPGIGYRIGRFAAFVDFQFLGDYRVIPASQFGPGVTFDLVYKNPLGTRFLLSYKVWKDLRFGITGEYLAFSSHSGFAGSDVPASPAKSLWDLGAMVAYDL